VELKFIQCSECISAIQKSEKVNETKYSHTHCVFIREKKGVWHRERKIYSKRFPIIHQIIFGEDWSIFLYNFITKIIVVKAITVWSKWKIIFTHGIFIREKKGAWWHRERKNIYSYNIWGRLKYFLQQKSKYLRQSVWWKLKITLADY